jgi:hypothetical protein
MPRTALLPVAFVAACMLPLATVSGWLLLLLLVPAAAAAWVVRVGVDIDDDGITVRSAIGQLRVPWNRLAGIRIDPRGGLWMVTTTGTEVHLPVLRVRDLPRLATLSGGRIEIPETPRPAAQ